MLLAADRMTDGKLAIDSFWSALGVALVASAVSVVLEVIFGTNDDDTYTLRVIQRIARRSGDRIETDAPGIIYLEIDGLALPVLKRAMRDGNAPNMARWLVEGGYTLTEWETDLSSQTGASQAGILLGSNEDIPAFRWVEKETATTMTCSAPPDCAEIERRHAGHGLLRDGGASRGNLLSGEADHVILTVSRMDAEKKANPGYRAFLANGFNVTRVLVLTFWEVVLELSASTRAKRRDVRPRGHRGGYYPLMRGALCVFVRDLIVYGVLQDMMKGRPAIYATFSSYDEVAHHSGLERADTLEALRKLDQQFGRIEAARVYAPRPYAHRRPLRPRPDPGSDVQAAQRLRARRARRALALRAAASPTWPAATSRARWSATRSARRPARKPDKKRKKNDVSDQDVVVMGSGNLGLVYLMEERRRLTLEEMNERHPDLIPALRNHPHVGWLLVRSSEHGPRRARRRRHALPRGRQGRGRRPAGRLLAERAAAPAPHRRVRPRRRHHDRQLLRRRARDRLRVRGADLVPRRHRRPADAAVHPASRGARGARRRRSSARPPFTRSWSAGGDELNEGTHRFAGGERGVATRRSRLAEHGRPVVLDAHDRPALRGRRLQRALGAGGVGELALRVVVQHEQPERRTILAAGVAQHRDVAVRVAAGDDRAPPDAAPDPHGLDRAVVEDVRRRLVGDGAAVLVVDVGERVRAADHALGRDAVDLAR